MVSARNRVSKYRVYTDAGYEMLKYSMTCIFGESLAGHSLRIGSFPGG
jgi:hypothetical protein